MEERSSALVAVAGCIRFAAFVHCGPQTLRASFSGTRDSSRASRSWVDPGHETGTGGNAASKSSRAMTKTTAG